MKKCAVCLKSKAKRECLLNEGALICSRCCVELRGDACGDCPHYADILRYQAERWRKGSLPEGHFIAEINPAAQQGVDDALALAEKGRMDEAMEDMERLVRDYPQCYDVFYGMGTLHGVQGHHEESIQWLEKCMAIFPYFAEAHFNMGVAYQKSYQLEKAVRANRKAMDYGDPEEEYYGHAKSFLEDMAKMIRKNNGVDLDTYLESSVMFDQAFAQMESGEWEDALAGFLACTKLIDNNASTYGNLALCYANLGRKADALAAFDRALELDPTYEPAVNNRLIAERMEEGTPLENVGFEPINYALEDLESRKGEPFPGCASNRLWG